MSSSRKWHSSGISCTSSSRACTSSARLSLHRFVRSIRSLSSSSPRLKSSDFFLSSSCIKGLPFPFLPFVLGHLLRQLSSPVMLPVHPGRLVAPLTHEHEPPAIPVSCL